MPDPQDQPAPPVADPVPTIEPAAPIETPIPIVKLDPGFIDRGQPVGDIETR